MRIKIKRFMCYATIVLLLPYIATVFLNGPVIATFAPAEETYVTVRAAEGEDADAAEGGTGAGEAGTVRMPLDEYGIGALAKEIPPSYKKEALKAQAILIRTGICRTLAEGGAGAVLTEDFRTREQMEKAWGAAKYSSNYRRLKEAWEETEGQIVTYGGKPANTPFCRLSNGSTRDGREALGSEEYPYLKIVECPLDVEAAEQIQTVTVDEMDAEVTECDTAGYVLSVRVGADTVSGEEFRENYHLASGCFTLQNYNGKLRITTRGVGHGLGLSQYTANEMAKEGKTAEEIIGYFFEGTELQEVADIVGAAGKEEQNPGEGE